MALIQMIAPRRARGELRWVYEEIHHDMVGDHRLPVSFSVWNIMRAFSLRPAFLRAFEKDFVLTMWEGALRRQAKEALGVTVSWANRCHY
jgi:hypothetical protein